MLLDGLRRSLARWLIPIGGERFGGQVPQIVGLRRGPERAYSSIGERGPQKQGREIPGSPRNRGGGVRISWGGMGCMGAEDPSAIRNQSSTGGRHARPPPRRGEPTGAAAPRPCPAAGGWTEWGPAAGPSPASGGAACRNGREA